MKALCYGEPCKILSQKDGVCKVEYSDGVIEDVPEELIEYQRVYKTKKPLRRTRIKKVNPKRRKELFKRNFHSKERVEKINNMSCSVIGCKNKNIANAHMKSRGAGGDYKSIIPLCHQHHQEEHQIGNGVFLRKYGINVKEKIKEVRELLGEI